MTRELFTQATDPNNRLPTGHGNTQQYPVIDTQPHNVGQPQYQANFMPTGPGVYPQPPQPNTYTSPPIPTQNQLQYPPPGVANYFANSGAPTPVEGYGHNSLQGQADARFVNNASPPVYNQPSDRKMDGSPQPQLPPQAYPQQQQQQIPQPQFQQPYQPPPDFSQTRSQPQPYPVMQTTQPVPVQGMDVRNVKNLPRTGSGEREWSHGLCDCFGDCGTCCLAYFCPCIVYSQVKSRLEHLQRNGYPHPEGGESTGADCFIYGALACLGGCGWVLQIGQRGSVRERYRIDGGGCSDCLTACFCVPCELTQESRELELEEQALKGNVVKV